MSLVAPVARAQAAPQQAHVHGAAKIGVVVQGDTVSITLESPLESLIGFEHRPKTPAQQAAATALQARMRGGTDLFRFDAARAQPGQGRRRIRNLPARAGGRRDRSAQRP